MKVKRKKVAALWERRCFVDILLTEGHHIVSRTSGLVEVGAEDLALEDGNFVERKDHSGLGVRGYWLHPENVFGKELFLVNQPTFCAFFTLYGEPGFGE